MKETVTVEKALSSGRRKLKYIPIIAAFSFIIGGFLLFYLKFFDAWIIALGFILGPLSGWLIWSYNINKWKIWAFENVRNVHTLQRKAFEQKLIWKKGSFFEKSVFKNYDQIQKLKRLETKFLEKDIFKDDISIPKETLIFYSKSTLILNLVIAIGFTGIGLYLILNKNCFGLLFVILGICIIADRIKNLRHNGPQITLNEKGIRLKDGKLIPWNEIYNDRVFTKSGARSSTDYLAFNNEMISINEMTITFEELENLLHVYRLRFENNI